MQCNPLTQGHWKGACELMKCVLVDWQIALSKSEHRIEYGKCLKVHYFPALGLGPYLWIECLMFPELITPDPAPQGGTKCHGFCHASHRLASHLWMAVTLK